MNCWNNPRLQRYRLTLAVSTAMGLTVAAMLPQVVSAQEQADLEEVIVTGSRIARDQFNGTTPVVTIDSQSIQASGFLSTQDVLDSLTQNTGGSLTQQEVSGFTPAASGINLRGAGLGRSLTLIDGVRVPKYPMAADGTVSFTDLSNIPVGAIERVEVLTSGASAIYGADAMGGVVNIILKDEFEGLQIDARTSDTDHGGRATYNISLLGGMVGERNSTVFFIEHEDREELYARERGNFDIDDDLAFDNEFGSYSSYGTALRGFDGLPVATPGPGECEARGRGFTHWDFAGVGICGFNRSPYRMLAPEQDRTSAMVTNKFKWTDDLQMETRVNVTRSNLYLEGEPIAIDEYSFFLGEGQVTAFSDITGSSAQFDQATAFGGDFAELPDGGYYYTRRAAEYGPRSEDYETTNFQFVNEFNGALGDHNWTAGFTWSRVEIDSKSKNVASADGFFGYISGQTNGNPNGNSLLDVISQADVEATRYTPTESSVASLSGLYLTFTGDVVELPAGMLKYAAGVETYREWFSRKADAATTNNEILSTGASGGRGTRENDSIYAEFLIPVIDTFELTAAIRYDDYSDFGDSTVIQFAGEWRPVEALLVRASWGETFRAPDLARVYGDTLFGFDQITDPLGCTNAGGTLGDTSIPACSGELFIGTTAGPNTDLNAEEGESWNIGAVYEFKAAGDWSAAIDYWHVEIDNIVNELDAQTIANDPDTYASQITRRAGFIDVINSSALNLSFQEAEGIDFSLKYTTDTDIGRFIASASATYITTFDDQFSDSDPVRDRIEGTSVPEWKGNFKVNWFMDKLSASMMVIYLGEMKGINADVFQDFGLASYDVDDQFKINLSGSYELSENVSFRLGINNVTDEGPNEDPTENLWPEYNPKFYNAIGREFYGSLSVSF